MFGLKIDRITTAAACERIVRWATGRPVRVRIVVTPNLDHVVRLATDSGLRRLYRQASLVLADGMPLVWASRMKGDPLPERVAGADLVVPVCQAAARAGLTVALLGPCERTLDRAIARLDLLAPGLHVVARHAPSMGFIRDAAECARMIEMVNVMQPDIVFVALGSPQQEIWGFAAQAQLKAKVVLCVGAGLDFVAGTRSRAAIWVRRLGMEWLHRALTEPCRLGPRYLRNALRLPGLIAREMAPAPAAALRRPQVLAP
ncbi:WecB/TagA/CpsF family glycosyltransferase [Marinivivus vitaminiproducens]|uniref:WecB/TagA/CpsF family glycosyltransferase n=1 Tax=Marinivivus vitaminiproducens TaxID=3035935 RepID=UPI0027A7CDD9|nr:WecB/TagA/CpsF family glycosyltransferase [Geminicoccaceae bacterium SCSIO 64248]